MREGIHPNFEKTTITCHCGNVMETMSTTKSARSATRSSPASRSWLTQADA